MVSTLCFRGQRKRQEARRALGIRSLAFAVGLTCWGWERKAFVKSCVRVSCYLIGGQKRRDGMDVIRVGPKGWGEISQAQNPEMAL